jgi:twitching motility protein PilI
MAKRISLREFQVGLVERLTSAARGESSRALLGVLAGQNYWLVHLSDAGEIVPLPPLTAVPLAKPWFAGLVNIRGVLYGVVDFSAFLGGEPTLQNSDARLLLIGARHGINSALLVSRTLGLKNPDALDALPVSVEGVATDMQPWAGERYAEKQGVSNTADAQRLAHAETPGIVWRMLHTKPLLGYSEFLNIGR